MLANAVSVLDIFEKKHRLEIPLFQRQYVWNQEQQWEPLWEDISRKISEYIQGRKDGPVHFLGAMVLDQKQTPTTHVDKRQVIDGQQRLTTLQLFLAALRDFCRERACEELAKEFDKLTRNEGRMVDPTTEIYKVWPTQRDRDQFRDVMDADSRSALEKKHPLIKLYRRRRFEPRPKMIESYLFFYSQLSAYFLGTPDEPPLAKELALEARLDETLKALKSALQVVVIDLGEGDSSSLMDWQGRYFPPDVFTGRVEELIVSARFIAPALVKEEIGAVGTAGLIAWTESHSGIFVPTVEVLSQAQTVQNQFAGLRDPKAEYEEADAYVIALATMRGGTVVTQETPAAEKRNPKRTHFIPDVCRELGIPCISLLGLIRREGWKF